jgi:CheY-like chemotaxis protein
VVANLVSNALKFGEPARAQIVVRAELHRDGKVHLSVSVLNNGPTIPPEEIAAIFGGFVRGSEAKKRKIAGSGIGLAVSRRLAEAMGGTLEAHSEAGTTEFTLRLHLEPADKPTAEAPTVVSASSRRALAIEDETYNRMVLQHTLEQLGFEADWAETGEQAMKLAASKSYDVILTDLALPDVDGITLAQRLLAQCPEPKPPIIAVTAYCTPEKIQQARSAGIKGFLTKPVSARKLSELLAN